MTEITIMCPECQHIIKIQVKTIDTLKYTIKTLTEENSRLTQRVFELENQKKVNDLFGGIFK